MKWVCDLPIEIQNEICRDAIEIETKYCSGVNLFETLDKIHNEKLINIIGHEDGLLDADKYWKYLFM